MNIARVAEQLWADRMDISRRYGVGSRYDLLTMKQGLSGLSLQENEEFMILNSQMASEFAKVDARFKEYGVPLCPTEMLN